MCVETQLSWMCGSANQAAAQLLRGNNKLLSEESTQQNDEWINTNRGITTEDEEKCGEHKGERVPQNDDP